MEKRLKEKMDAICAFEKFCRENEIIWSSLGGFANCVDALGNKINSILEEEAEQEKDSKGVTSAKNEKKISLANETVAVSQALQAYSLEAGNSILLQRMSVTFTKIKQAKDTGAISQSQLVYDTANGLPIDEIKPFGIDETTLQLLKNTIEEFRLHAPTTRNVVTNKTVLTTNLNKEIGEANTIMRKQIMKLGRQFKKTHPDFYKGLIANAKVIRNSVHSKIRLTCVDAETNVPIADADVVIEGTGLKGRTDLNGKVTVTRVQDAKLNVVITKQNYKSLTLEGIIFKRGHSITRKIEMAPVFDLNIEHEWEEEMLI